MFQFLESGILGVLLRSLILGLSLNLIYDLKVLMKVG